MVPPVGGGLGIMPSKFVVLHNVLIISSGSRVEAWRDAEEIKA
jgi:hypothetical protein